MKKFRRLLAIILAVCFLLAVTSVFSTSAANAVTVKGKFDYDYANSVLALVNQQRTANGLSALSMDKELVDGAMKRAAECKVSFSHTRPNGTSCFTAFNWQSVVGENIAYGQRTPEQVMNAWMNSQGHRENILKASFKKIGVGCFAADNGTIYWAQEFSGGSSSGYSASGSKAVTVNVSLSSGAETTVSFTSQQPPSTAQQQPATTQATAPTSAAQTVPTEKPTTASKPTNNEKTCALKTPVINSVKLKSGKALIKWNAVKNCGSYQVQFCTKSDFKSNCKLVTTTATSLKTGRLCCGKVYCRVRACTKANGKTCCSAWSAVKSKRI